MRVLIALAVALTTARGALAAADPAACPSGGFARVGCLLAIAAERPRCGPERFEASLAKRLARVAKLVGLAETHEALGRRGAARKALRRAAIPVRASQAKIGRMVRGRLAGDCAVPLDALLATLHLSLATLELGTPPPVVPTTTTTPPSTAPPTTRAPTTTVTTTSLVVTTTTRPATCGNGNLDPGEQCDGENLFGRDCKTLGFISGTLRCDASCIFDNRDCHQY